jgi:lipopolysaccharide export system protein LptA
MKKVLVLSMLGLQIFAANLEITSKKFTYNESKQISTFTEDVNATKGIDNILCNKMDIYFDKNKKPIKIIATDNVRFVLQTDVNSTYKGKSKKLTYLVPQDQIKLEGSVSIKKIEDEQKLYGEEVFIDKKNKKAKVIGIDKPIKFIIKVDD